MPACDREPEIRGICTQCYQSTSRMVRNGKANWPELEARGLVLPAAPGKPPTPARQAIEDLTAPGPIDHQADHQATEPSR